MMKPVRCYNRFKGESKQETQFIDQEYWNEFANDYKTDFWERVRVFTPLGRMYMFGSGQELSALLLVFYKLILISNEL